MTGIEGATAGNRSSAPNSPDAPRTPSAPRVYLIDPLGNLMMSYAANIKALRG